MNWRWERNRYHFSIFADMQRHRCGAATAQPVILRCLGFGRAESRVSFQSKEPPLLQMAKGGGTRRVRALGEHNGTPLLQFKSGRGQTLLNAAGFRFASVCWRGKESDLADSTSVRDEPRRKYCPTLGGSLNPHFASWSMNSLAFPKCKILILDSTRARPQRRCQSIGRSGAVLPDRACRQDRPL